MELNYFLNNSWKVKKKLLNEAQQTGYSSSPSLFLLLLLHSPPLIPPIPPVLPSLPLNIPFSAHSLVHSLLPSLPPLLIPPSLCSFLTHSLLSYLTHVLFPSLSFSLPHSLTHSLFPSLPPSITPSLPLSFPYSLTPPSSLPHSLLPFNIQWNNANSYKLLSLLSPEDQEEFDFDLRKLNWPSYFIQYCLGTKRYLFNEDPANIPIARRQIKR